MDSELLGFCVTWNHLVFLVGWKNDGLYLRSIDVEGEDALFSIPINTSWNGCNVTFDLVYVNYELRNIYVGLSMI